MDFPYIYRWNRMGRKGQACRVTARGGMNSARVEFPDGHVAITSRNALRKAPLPAWRIVSPAPRSAALACAGAGARVRRLQLKQVRDNDSVAVYRGADVLAVVYFGRHGWRRVEMALAIAPAAVPHMARLVRMAQLTLFAMAETHLIVAVIRPFNRAGQRMAMLVGFQPSRLKRRDVWILRKNRHERTSRRERSGEAGGRRTESPAGGRQ